MRKHLKKATSFSVEMHFWKDVAFLWCFLDLNVGMKAFLFVKVPANFYEGMTNLVEVWLAKNLTQRVSNSVSKK